MTLKKDLGLLATWKADQSGVAVGRYLDRFSISFKPTSDYLTTEGWPLGTECWYVFVQTDSQRVFICRKKLTEALNIAVTALLQYFNGDDSWADGINPGASG